jgi:Cu(I)/Ag(I) efflux system protein CusF
MKRLIVLSAALALSVAVSPLSRAQGMGGMDMKGMDMGKDKKSESKVHKGAGTVKKIDPVGGKVTIAHGPIPTMKWPAMNMTFTVKDKALLAKFSQDKKVEFEFVEQGSDYVIKSVK